MPTTFRQFLSNMSPEQLNSKIEFIVEAMDSHLLTDNQRYQLEEKLEIAVSVQDAKK